MHKLTVVTAALAAGVFSVAFSSANSAPLSPRADQGLVAASAKSGKASPAKATKRAPAKVEKASLTHAKKARAKKRSRGGGLPVDTMTTASIGAGTVALPTTPAAADGQYSAIVARYAASYGVPVSLAQAVIRIESNYRPNTVGSAGEIGLMQIKPATARMMGYSGSAKGLFDPDTNIKYGMKYLAMARNLGGGTTCGTILKYNAGHAATRMNPVSAAYCSKVKVQMAAL